MPHVVELSSKDTIELFSFHEQLCCSAIKHLSAICHCIHHSPLLLFNNVLLFAVVQFPGIIFPVQGEKFWFIVVFLTFDYTDSHSEVIFLLSPFYCMAIELRGSY